MPRRRLKEMIGTTGPKVSSRAMAHLRRHVASTVASNRDRAEVGAASCRRSAAFAPSATAARHVRRPSPHVGVVKRPHGRALMERITEHLDLARDRDNAFRRVSSATQASASTRPVAAQTWPALKNARPPPRRRPWRDRRRRRRYRAVAAESSNIGCRHHARRCAARQASR